MEMPEKHIYYIKITEDVSDYDPEFKPRADFGVILEDAIMGEYVRVAEDVSQEVEALKAENEELKAAVTMLEQKLRDVNKAHDRAEAKLDKARDCLGQISRMKTLPDHTSNTMTLVAAHQLARAILEEIE